MPLIIVVDEATFKHIMVHLNELGIKVQLLNIISCDPTNAPWNTTSKRADCPNVQLDTPVDIWIWVYL